MDCCHCPKMRNLIKQIISETPQPAPAPAPEPKILETLTGIQAQITNTPGKLLYTGEQLMFDSIIMSNNPNIKYDNGRFNISKSGTYFISWQVATTSMGIDQYSYFSIAINGVEYSISASPTVKGQISGTAIINVNSGDYITLVNTNVGGESVMFGHSLVLANIIIMGVS